MSAAEKNKNTHMPTRAPCSLKYPCLTFACSRRRPCRGATPALPPTATATGLVPDHDRSALAAQRLPIIANLEEMLKNARGLTENLEHLIASLAPERELPAAPPQ